MHSAKDKSSSPDSNDVIRVLQPKMSKIPKSVSATVAAHANGTVKEAGKSEVTAPVYSTK